MSAASKSEIEIVTSIDQAESAAQRILSSGLTYCGLDCEWVGKNKTGRGSIFLVNQSIIRLFSSLFQALIQISVFIDGQVHCFLFRICKFSLLACPSLIRLLKSESLIKLGVGIDGDMKKLAKEFEPSIIQVVFSPELGKETAFVPHVSVSKQETTCMESCLGSIKLESSLFRNVTQPPFGSLFLCQSLVLPFFVGKNSLFRAVTLTFGSPLHTPQFNPGVSRP